MMKYEKAAVFLILIFVVLIVALNIYGSLSMLIIEKEDDIETLRAMGATDTLVRRIFVLEGWLISLSGLAVGLIAGIALALLQQHFGFVKMPGSFIVTAYPVVVKFTDVLLTVAGVALTGLGVALFAARKR
jgi:ABC-type lipoprotein release transport system permease subunit